MSHIFGNAIKETTTTTGTGAITLAGAVATFQTFASRCVNGDTFWYRIAHQTLNEWEVGIGTWNTGGTITRTAANVTDGSAGAAALVTFSAGTKDVLLVAPGHQMGGIITPTTTGNIDNWAPTNLAEASEIRWNGAAGAVLRGLTGGWEGREIRISNVTADQALVIMHEAAGSTAANRFTNNTIGRGNHIVLFPSQGAKFKYRAAASRWEVIDSTYEPSLFSKYRRVLSMYPGTGTAPHSLGIAHTSAGGTISHPAIAATNFATSLHRVRGATGVTAGTQSGTRGTQSLGLRGNLAGVGGFHFRANWGKNTNTAGASEFVGMATNAAPGNVNASAILSQVGFQRDPAETEYRIGSNDATTTATRTTLGTDFPCNSTTAVFEGHLWCAPNGAAILWAAWRIDDLTLTPQCGTLTTDLPINTTVMTPHVWCCNRADAATIEIEWQLIEIGLP